MSNLRPERASGRGISHGCRRSRVAKRRTRSPKTSNRPSDDLQKGSQRALLTRENLAVSSLELAQKSGQGLDGLERYCIVERSAQSAHRAMPLEAH